MSDMEQYAIYFTPGLKITVCIPMDNNELFRDWAIVEELDEDIITLVMSRDELPMRVHLITGVNLDLRLGKEGKGFRCSGFFVGDAGSGKILVHLTGDVSTSELREFYRIDAFMPFRYHFMEEQNLDVLIGTWRKRRQNRIAVESERRDAFNEKHREILLRVANGEFDANEREQVTKQLEAEEFNPIDESWDNVNAMAINLSAGGLKFVTTEMFKVGELVYLEMFIPSTPPRIMESITKVVFKNNNNSIKDGKEHFNVALSFVVIDDRDRDAIVSRISHLESLRIRQKQQLPLFAEKSENNNISLPMVVIYSVMFVVLTYLVFLYLNDYSQSKIHNEIGEMFQNAVRKYREQTGQKW